MASIELTWYYISKLSHFLKEAKLVALNVFCAVPQRTGQCASVNAVIKRTALLTNVSDHGLYKWVTELRRNCKVASPKKLSCGGKGNKRKKSTSSIWVSCEDWSMTISREIKYLVKKLTDHFNADEMLPLLSSSTMHRMLRNIGFRFKKWYRNALLIEATHVIQWRRKYMRQIRELRHQGRPIFYTDETWVNVGHTTNRVWADESVTRLHLYYTVMLL